jgi:hypothetical protein
MHITRLTSPLGHYSSRLALAATLHGYLFVLSWHSQIMADGPDSTPNDAAPWPDFDAEGYWKFSYASFLPEDAQIILRAGNFLIEAFGHRAPASSAVDVAAGSNLYPALLMLPLTERITFTDFAGTNINWLGENLADAPVEWAWHPRVPGTWAACSLEPMASPPTRRSSGRRCGGSSARSRREPRS